jgi:beta-aspartyl-peptidase (threonine type)
MNNTFSLMIHGGAGKYSDIKLVDDENHYLDHIGRILEKGRDVLQKGGTAIQAVEVCVCALEDDELFNAGRGSVLNAIGAVEMDAGIVDGLDLSAGAVGAVTSVKNPVRLAECIRQQGQHVMLVGDAALALAKLQGLNIENDGYFIVEKRRRQFLALQGTDKSALDHDVNDEQDAGQGTVGAVARDLKGNLAAATSTGGLINKRVGRVGDTPVIGAGVYADNQTCAISATGNGEEIMRVVLAKRIADSLELLHCDLSEALDANMRYFAERVSGQGGVIAIDKQGVCCGRHTTTRMLHGWIENGGERICRFEQK